MTRESARLTRSIPFCLSDLEACMTNSHGRDDSRGSEVGGDTFIEHAPAYFEFGLQASTLR